MNLTYSRLTSLSLLWCLFLNLVHRQKLALLLSYKSNHLSAMDVVQYNCCAYNDNNCKKVFPKRAGIQNIIIIQQHNYTKKIVCLRISIPKVCRNPNNIQLRVQTFFYKIAFLMWIVPNLWLNNNNKNLRLVTKYQNINKHVFQSAKQSPGGPSWLFSHKRCHAFLSNF